MTQYTTQELAQELKVDLSTLGIWAKQFEVPRERQNNKWLYPTEAKAVLTAIKDLKSQDCGFNTITRYLAQEVRHLPSESPLFNTDHIPSGTQLTIFDFLT